MAKLTLLADVPSFDLLEDRSEDGSPNLAITFPDGYSDTIVLTKYFASEDDKVQERMSGVEDCNFVGHLKNEKACLAMTGCLDSEFREFTIFSEHAGHRTSYRWFSNGTVESIPTLSEVTFYSCITNRIQV